MHVWHFLKPGCQEFRSIGTISLNTHKKPPQERHHTFSLGLNQGWNKGYIIRGSYFHVQNHRMLLALLQACRVLIKESFNKTLIDD